MNMDKKEMKTICVFCGSSDNIHADFKLAGRLMGRVLAENGLRLIFGGGRSGVMGAVADGVLQAGGEAIGVLIESMNTPALAYPGLTRLDVLATMHERKAHMHSLAEAFIALPGGLGTFDELFETLTWGQIGVHEKPVGLLNVRGYFDPLLAMLLHAEREGFVFAEHREMLLTAEEPQALLDALKKHQHPRQAVKRWMKQDE
jgi:uncharacterized protein (TIGR00730 family)